MLHPGPAELGAGLHKALISIFKIVLVERGIKGGADTAHWASRSTWCPVTHPPTFINSSSSSNVTSFSPVNKRRSRMASCMFTNTPASMCAYLLDVHIVNCY